MSLTFRIVPIVEGHGDEQAVPILLRRLCGRIDPSRSIEVLRPIRVHRSKISRPDELERYVSLAIRKLQGGSGAILLLLDADDDCPADLGPRLLQGIRSAREDVVAAVVLAKSEYEAWFLAAARSLAGRRGLPDDIAPPREPENVRDAKGWLQAQRADGLAYGPTTDQPALTHAFDLDEARHGCPSFEKLWRDVERLMAETAS